MQQRIMKQNFSTLILNNFRTLLIVFCVFLFSSCTQEKKTISISAQNYYACIDQVTNTLVHDIFSPPVASRVYVYPNIAAYEIIAQNDENYLSLSSQIESLQKIPVVNADAVNTKVAALVAYMEVSKKLTFTHDFVNKLQDSLYKSWEKINKNEFEVSKNYGEKVAQHIQEWFTNDHYNQTRTMPKFSVDTDDISRWQPTPPSYMDGIEPHWNKITPLVLNSASQFKPERHPDFSLEKTSDFYKELLEVYQVTNEIREKGDEAEEVKIAQFWDCNPYVAVSTGHLTVATKKITPGGHWVGITKIACIQNKLSFEEAIYAHTYTSIGMFDAFISCWDEKYRSNLIRPETLINTTIDKNWIPLLQTPPFPEYTSGHSVVSGAASTILTHVFKDNFAFVDTTELPYGLPSRKFTSFNQAAEEAAISRLYGGIHYRAAVDNGLVQGRNIGKYICEKIQLKKKG